MGVKTLAAAAVVVAVATLGGEHLVGGACGCATPEFSSGVGNLWIVTSGGSDPCTRQSSPTTLAAATSTAKCSTPQAAQNAASGGDTVMIQDGTYSSTFALTSGTKASTVTYQADGWTPPSDAVGVMSDTIKVVYTGGVSLENVDKVHVLGVSATSTPNSAGSGTVNQNAGTVAVCSVRANCTTQNTDVLIQGFHGKAGFVNGSGVTIDLSEFGGFDGCEHWVPSGGASNGSYVGGGQEDIFNFQYGAPTDITQMGNDTLKRSALHDESMSTTFCGSDAASHGPHTDCMQNYSGTNMVIDSNLFFDCPEQFVQWNNFNSGGSPVGGTFANATIKNNYFGAPGPNSTSSFGSFAVTNATNGGANCSTLVMENNVMYGTNNTAGACPGGNAKSYGNVHLGTGSACSTSQTYDFDVFASGWTTTCGTNTQHCDPSWVNVLPGFSPGSIPNPLLSGSDTCAKAHGNPTFFPSLDIHGNSRPLGTVDAGPSEVP